MTEVIEEIISGIVEIFAIMRDTSFQIWTFNVSLFHIFMSLLILEFILSVIFPWFMAEDDD